MAGYFRQIMNVTFLFKSCSVTIHLRLIPDRVSIARVTKSRPIFRVIVTESVYNYMVWETGESAGELAKLTRSLAGRWNHCLALRKHYHAETVDIEQLIGTTWQIQKSLRRSY